MSGFIKIINKILSSMCVVLCSILVLCVVWQVCSRYVLNTPSTYTDELARFLFIWVGLIGAAYALGQKKHLAIDLLATKLETSPSKQNLLNLCINIIGLFFTLSIMCYGGMRLVQDTIAHGQISPVIGIQMGVVYLAIPISGLFMLIYLVRDIFENAKQLSH
ncbi:MULTISPECIES: TRAP transporter small permease [Gallibacterium]|uniref:TRAP transporter small permease protein n=1 Tax=Gallibacterium genomosp. 3 TaxID=505345 RepID=A0A1A7PQK9_9PAST|nr:MULTISPECIES: TRAP transporter small permease [Gallibacterium]MDA3979816.1 TRAP transporter small permease [Gallibacterium sp. AGMB14963]OBX04007.1 C4-dicarboxylate ABC transporter permease [Gallibacterium genomosp. 3]